MVTGISRFRKSSSAVVRETASRTFGPWSAKSRIPGMTPLVETVIRRLENPSPPGSVRIPRARRSSLRFSRGSPIPIITMLAISGPSTEPFSGPDPAV